jgi:hypothetical protein
MVSLSPSTRRKIKQLTDEYIEVSPVRKRALFDPFLVRGLQLITLTSVSPTLNEVVLLAKLYLTTIIILLDDLADHPQHKNSPLLRRLYKINLFSEHSSSHSPGDQDNIYELVCDLFLKLRRSIIDLPHTPVLAPFLEFDIGQFYQANRYSELISACPEAASLIEIQMLGPNNMGITAFGVIDLMASPRLRLDDLGACREVFTLGQRAGRISNTIATFARELSEGDVTNEIIAGARRTSEHAYRGQILREFNRLIDEIWERGQAQRTFDSQRYGVGLRELHELHMAMVGTI